VTGLRTTAPDRVRAPGGWRALLPVVALVTHGACADPQTTGGAVIALSPDPNRNTADQIAAELERVEILLDATQGGFNGLGDPPAGFRAIDPDGDGQPELMVTMEVGADGALPELLLEPGSNHDTPIAVRARGLDAQGRVAAYGGAAARALFESDQQPRILVPFNLSPSHLPPRIVAVVPQKLPTSSLAGSPSLAAVAFYSSRQLDSKTVNTDNVHVWVGARELKGSFKSRPCAGGLEMWTFSPAECVESLLITGELMRIKLVIDATVKDTDGRAIAHPGGFEQSTDLTLAQFGACQTIAFDCFGYVSSAAGHVDLRCNPGTKRLEPTPCSLVPGSCGSPWLAFTWRIAESAAQCESFHDGAAYVEEHGSCAIEKPWPCNHPTTDCKGVGGGWCDLGERQCEPAPCTDPDSCPGGHLVCVSQRCLPRIGACLDDCQRFGGCPTFSKRCDADDHVCR